MNRLKLTHQFERFFVIPRLALILTLGSVLCFIFSLISPDYLPFIAFIPERVLEGEIWRLASFIFYPFDMHPIFAFFTYYLFFLMGSALESRWGAAKFNLFMFLSYLGTIAAAFLFPHAIATNYYIYIAVYLAFARLYPELELYLFFVLPVKIKWLAWIAIFFTAVDFVGSGWPIRAAILAVTVNLLIFFGAELLRGTRQQLKAVVVEKKAAEVEAKPFHTCHTCAASEKTRPTAVFRVCSICAGGLEYCDQHLSSHNHIS